MTKETGMLNRNGKTALQELEEALGEPMESEEEELEEEEDVDLIEKLLEAFPNGPTRDQIEAWKKKWGAIHAYVPDNDRMYLFRPLKGMEAKAIKAKSNEFAATQKARENPEVLNDFTQESIVRACLMYPSTQVVGDVEFFNQSNGGLVGTLYGLIMEHSDFVTPQKALSQTLRL